MSVKILLVAVNAKYIHSNPAIYSLKSACANSEAVSLAEYTINHQREKVLADIYEKGPDLVAFSCYIWNIAYIQALIPDLKQLMPKVPLWLGGPEVSHRGEVLLRENPQIRGVMVGEGEETFPRLVSFYTKGEPSLERIPGLIFWENKQVINTGLPDCPDMAKLPFCYQDVPKEQFSHRILYYESARGCPFSCSYCLSSLRETAGKKRVRFRPLAQVKRELSFFLEQNVQQVKFVDRTFNCDRDRALEIWTYIRDHSNGVTNFHFEVAGDLLDEKSLELLASMPPGTVQLEIGIQTVNEKTLREIRRVTDLPRLFANVKRLTAMGNIHCHVDLIAGLPFEDFWSFRRSFNAAYALGAHQLQLGFLKVLKGSAMEEQAPAYDLQYSRIPPYEVLSTRWISYGELRRLKEIEEMVELYSNSGQFCRTLPVAAAAFETPFDFFEALADYYRKQGLAAVSHSRAQRYEILGRFCEKELSGRLDIDLIRELLVLDLYAREALKSRPAWAPPLAPFFRQIQAFYEREAVSFTYLKGYEGFTAKQLRRMTHLEPLRSGKAMLFDYRNRDPVTGNGNMTEVSIF